MTELVGGVAVLGAGQFAVVRHAVHKETRLVRSQPPSFAHVIGSGAYPGHPPQEVAVKVIKKEMFKGQKEELRLKAEVRAPPAHSKSILCR